MTVPRFRLEGTGTISPNTDDVQFSSVNSFTLAADTGSSITFSGFVLTGAYDVGSVLRGDDVTLGSSGSTGTLIFDGNSTNNHGGAIFTNSSFSIAGGTNTFTNNSAVSDGGAIFAVDNATLRATDGDFLFRGNVDGKNTVDEKANAIDFLNGGGNHTLTLAAEANRKIEFFDPITSDYWTNLTISINPNSSDTGTIIFDGAYWTGQGKTVAADPAYFETKLYGNATLSHGKLEIKNGAIFDVIGKIVVDNSGTLEVKSGSTLVTGIYDNSGTWTSSITTADSGKIDFASGAIWYVREGSAFTGGALAGTINATGSVQAALDEGNKKNTLYDFKYDSTSQGITARSRAKGDMNDTIVNTAIMFIPNAMGTAAAGRVQQRFGLLMRESGVYRGQACEPCSLVCGTRGGKLSMWANYIGRSTELVSSSTIAGLAGTAKIVSNGVQIGADQMIGRRTIVGAMFNYEHARDTLNASRVSGDNYAFARVGSDFIVKQNRLTMNSGFYYSYQMSEFGDRVRTTAAIAPAAPVNIWGSDFGRNKLTFNVGGSYALGATKATSIFGGYSGDYFTDRAGTPWGHNGFAGVRWAF